MWNWCRDMKSKLVTKLDDLKHEVEEERAA